MFADTRFFVLECGHEPPQLRSLFFSDEIRAISCYCGVTTKLPVDEAATADERNSITYRDGARNRRASPEPEANRIAVMKGEE